MNEVKIGDGATWSVGSDCYPYTVIGIDYFKSGARKGQVSSVIVQEDRAYRTDNRGAYTESQEYTYERNPMGRTSVVKINRKGQPSERVTFGVRRKYFDPCF